MVTGPNSMVSITQLNPDSTWKKAMTCSKFGSVLWWATIYLENIAQESSDEAPT
jgi:hypothetical protein